MGNYCPLLLFSEMAAWEQSVHRDDWDYLEYMSWYEGKFTFVKNIAPSAGRSSGNTMNLCCISTAIECEC